jgi:NAD-dependent SIR2 family protein deacetylase
MQEKKVVVLLGAGASKVLGFPLQQEMWDFLTPRSSDEFFYSPVQYLRLRYGKNREVEEVFTFLETEAVDGSNTLSFGVHSPKLEVMRLKELISEKLETVKFKKSGVFLHQKFISVLGRFFQEIVFISLNWDTSLETILHGSNCVVNYQTIFDQDLLISGKKVSEGERREIEVLKLHGSINWKFCHRCKNLFLGSIKEKSRRYAILIENYRDDTEALRRACEALLRRTPSDVGVLALLDGACWVEGAIYRFPCCPNCGAGAIETIIHPPSFRKVATVNPFDSVTRRAFQHLSSADSIVVIGCSFRPEDYDVRYLLEGGVSANRTKKIVVFDNAEVFARIESFFRFKNSPRWRISLEHVGYLELSAIKRMASVFTNSR